MPVFRSRVLVGRWWQVALRVAGVILMAGILWWGIFKYWRFLILGGLWGDLQTEYWVLSGSFPSGWPAVGPIWRWAGVTAVIVAPISAVILLIGLLFERLRVDDHGASLFIGWPAFTLFRIPWARIAAFDVISHNSAPPSIIFHYRPWLLGRFAVGLHPERYDDPAAVGDEVLGQLKTRGVPGRFWFVPRMAQRLGVWSLVAGGLIIGGIVLWLRIGMTRWLAIDTDADALTALPPPGLVALGYSIAIAAFSFGFGCLSAYHRGRARFVLFLIWLLAAEGSPPLLIYMLTYIAVVAILFARLTPLTIGGDNPTLLPPPTWQMSLAPILAYFNLFIVLVFYLLGLYLFRRPGPAWDYTAGGESVVSG